MHAQYLYVDLLSNFNGRIHNPHYDPPNLTVAEPPLQLLRYEAAPNWRTPEGRLNRELKAGIRIVTL